MQKSENKHSLLVKILILPIKNAILRLWKFFSAERKILFVSDQKIRTFNLGPIIQISAAVTFIWILGLFIQTFIDKSTIHNKSKEISRLKKINDYFEKEITNVNSKLSKINEYLFSIAGDNDDKKLEDTSFEMPNNVHGNKISQQNKSTISQIKTARDRIVNIQFLAHKRISDIQSAIALTGLNIEKMPQDFPEYVEIKSENLTKIPNNNISGQGGPLAEDDSIDLEIGQNSSGQDLDYLANQVFTNEIDHLIFLENIAALMPFGNPMDSEDHYISSSFGTRVDPITGRKAKHKGIDFVGHKKHAEIRSPSKGKIILAGRFSEYGNAVVIDHGFGITTRYGHLSELKVKKGQIVEKGDLIALQGNTGRSTGSHLHYEVRYKNSPLNPQKFLSAGKSLSDPALLQNYKKVELADNQNS